MRAGAVGSGEGKKADGVGQSPVFPPWKEVGWCLRGSIIVIHLCPSTSIEYKVLEGANATPLPPKAKGHKDTPEHVLRARWEILLRVYGLSVPVVQSSIVRSSLSRSFLGPGGNVSFSFWLPKCLVKMSQKCAGYSPNVTPNVTFFNFLFV